MAGFVYAPFGDLEATARLVDDETAAIIIEPIQGEGGVRIPPDGFLAGLRKLADERELLLVFDEVQTGCGRTGDWFAYQGVGVTPDIMTLAKSICGGLPGAAMLAKAEIAASLRPGMHAATFGGNPIAARAGLAAIEMIEEQDLLAAAKRLGELFRRRLERLQQECDLVREVRVRGRDDRRRTGRRRGPRRQGVPGAKTADQLHPRNGDPPAAGVDPHRGTGRGRAATSSPTPSRQAGAA